MLEIWKNIPGIIGYQVSNLGRVRSMRRTVNCIYDGIKQKRRTVPARILKSCNTYTHGRQHYVTVSLNSKTRAVHRLVALAFLGPPPFGPKTEVNHKDGNKHNNAVSNLEWCSKKMNEQHSQMLRRKRLTKGLINESNSEENK